MPQNNTRYLFKDNPDYGKFFLQDILEDISELVYKSNFIYSFKLLKCIIFFSMYFVLVMYLWV